MKNDKYLKLLDFIEKGFGTAVQDITIYVEVDKKALPAAKYIISKNDTFKAIFVAIDMINSILLTMGLNVYDYNYDPKNYRCIIIYMKIPKYYNVKFHYIKDETISMETVISAHSKEEAESTAIFKASKALEIHEQRFHIDSITEEPYE